jgi:D-ribulokinase
MPGDDTTGQRGVGGRKADRRGWAMRDEAGAGTLVLGIDIGTSGVRVAALDEAGAVVAFAGEAMAAPDKAGAAITQDPAIWWQATQAALAHLRTRIDPARVAGLAVDATSGTIVAIDGAGAPVAPARLYNDASAGDAAGRIAAVAPPQSAAHGASSALGRAMGLAGAAPRRIVHQADWIVGQLTGCFGTTDENNALKTGYDPVARRWPDWIEALGLDIGLLSKVVPVATPLAPLSADIAARFGLPAGAMVFAGTTDGCAAFLATGADTTGDGVTSLGTTLVLKLLCDAPLFAPAYGLYSHRIGSMWLAGGASNAGGAALLAHFTAQRLSELEPLLLPEQPTGLDYYPLPATGERFPINDPALEPRLTPRPADDAVFLQGLLEGIAAVEALGYRRLAELGAPALRSVRSVGGGAKNDAWRLIRARTLGVPLLPPRSDEAAVGAALVARQGLLGGYA